MTSRRVLVTGAFGLVGTEVVSHLVTAGHEVVATDLRTAATIATAASTLEPRGVSVAWGDLTDPADADRVVEESRPDAVIHLAAIIPPLCYTRAALTRAVNVQGTEHLLAAVTARAPTARWVQASSVAVYGPRNPHRTDTLLGADTPTVPVELYGVTKLMAEDLVRRSRLDALVLRLGGVMFIPTLGGGNDEPLVFEAALPADGRIQTVDVRDVARAFVAALDAPSTPRPLLIGGDPSHRLRQRDISRGVMGAMGMAKASAPGLPGDPDDDTAWFGVDWMDTTESQALLDYQRVSWPQFLADVGTAIGWRRHLLGAIAPLARIGIARRSPYRGQTLSYADPWAVIARTWGDPAMTYPDPQDPPD